MKIKVIVDNNNNILGTISAEKENLEGEQVGIEPELDEGQKMHEVEVSDDYRNISDITKLHNDIAKQLQLS